MAPGVHMQVLVTGKRIPSRLTTVALAILLLAASPADAALKVIAKGPRSATVAATVRQGLERAGVREGTVVVQVRRGHPAWTVSVGFYRGEQGQALVTQSFRAPHGELAPGLAQQLGRRVAAALGRGGKPGPQAARPSPRPASPPAPAPAGQEPARPRPGPAPAPPPPRPAAPPQRPAAAEQPASPAPPPSAPPAGDDLGFETPSAEGTSKAPRRPLPRMPRRAPAAATGSGEDLGFETGERGADGSERGAATVQQAPEADSGAETTGASPPGRTVLRVDAGFGLASRRFLLDEVSRAVDYATGLYSQISIHGEVYPLQFLSGSFWARLGLRLGFETSAGLNTDLKLDGVNAQSFATSVRRLWGGLTYWLPRFANRHAPTFDLRLGLIYQTFEIDQNPLVQDLSLVNLAAGGLIGFPVRRWLSFGLAGEYRGLLRGRSPGLDAFLIPTAGVQGFSLEGSVQGRLFGGLGYRGAFTFERLTGDLAARPDGPAPADARLYVRDHYYSAEVALAYEL